MRKIKEGDVFYSLKVIKNLGYRKFCNVNTTFFQCECLKCGNIVEVPMRYLGRNKKDCGCGVHEARKPIEIGTVFGRLTVLENLGRRGDRGYQYLCECECDKKNKVVVLGSLLRSGETRSCGCIHDELLREKAKKAYQNNYVKGTAVNKITATKLQSNNTSGVRGVSWEKNQKKWQASIGFQKKSYHLGYFNDLEEAKQARQKAEEELFGNFLEWYAEKYPEQWKKKKKKRRKREEKQEE